MNKVEQLEKLQARKVELLTIMAKSDKHALKCYKLGKKFQTQYPEEYAEYVAANEEYQQVERDINNLEFELSLEENGTESEGTAATTETEAEASTETEEPEGDKPEEESAGDEPMPEESTQSEEPEGEKPEE